MTFESALSMLRRRWVALILCVLAGIGGAFAHVHTSAKLYRSTARLFINIPAAQSTQEALQGVQLSSQLIQSYADIVSSRTTAQQVKDRLGLSESAAQIASKLSATPQPNTLIIAVSATDTAPARAQSIAQAAAVVLNDSVQSLEHDRTPTSAVEASIIDDANTPGAPISPRPTRDLLLGLILGLIAGVAVSLVVEALDRSVKTTSEVERLVGAPPLAVVPKIKGSTPLLAGEPLQTPAAESYRALRTSLRFLDLDAPLRSLVVTSPSADEGKSTTAANLALALAQAGERVILVDADLRQAGLSELLDIESAVGLTGVLTGEVALEVALQQYRPTMQVLAAGALPPNPSELLGSQRMSALVSDLVARCDVVIFDAPPVLPVTDAVVLSTQVDGTTLVVNYGRTPRNHAAEAARRISTVDAELVGFILNRRPKPDTSAYYSAYQPRESAALRPPIEA